MKCFLSFFVRMVCIALVSCDGSDETPPDIGKNYLPLQTGSFQVYNVERTVYELGIPSTSFYELRTAVVDSFLNAENTITYVVHRSTRPDDQSPWQYLDTWSVRGGEAESVVQEGNLPVVKLKYPVTEGLSWDANQYNTLEDDDFTIESVRAALTFDDLTFEDCLTVNQNDNDDFIVFLDQRKEIFARGVGLVYKDSTWLKYCTQNDCLGQQVVEQGVLYKQTIKAYGTE